MNILLLQLKRIGDLVLTTPAIAAVREKLPDADITLVVAAGSRELLPAIRGVDTTIVAQGKIADAADWFTIARKRYDYCFDFTRTDRSAFLTLLSRATERVTADHPRFRMMLRAMSYNQLVDLPINEMHTVDYHLGLLQPLGIHHASPMLQLELPPVALERADAVLADAGLLAGEFLIVHPGSARLEKFWDAARWATIIDLAADHDLKCIVTGGSSALEQRHIAEIRSHCRRGFVDLAGQVDLLTLSALIKRAKLLTTVDSAPVHLAVATRTPVVVLFGPTNPLHWRPRFTPAVVLQAGNPEPVTHFQPKQKARPMNLLSTEQVIDAMRSLLTAPQAATSGMSGLTGIQPPNVKRTFWQTLKAASGPYRRLFVYVKPYKWRFGLGLGFGFLYGAINSILPIVLGRVMAAVFQGGPMNPHELVRHSEQLDSTPQMSLHTLLLCLGIPAVMTARSLVGYLNAYYMTWVSMKVLTDIRNQLFETILAHSMDFFNKMRSGFLMSRITNDTRMMQTALSTVSSDIFKQPVAIIGGVSVLLYLDWKFTIVTLILFPTCIIPITIYSRRARRAAKYENEDMGQMVVTMQETFAGIRVIKSFAREDFQAKSFKRSNRLLFENGMRITRAMEGIGPLVETIAAIGVGLALIYVYFSHLSAARFIALNTGIFLLYEPIKTLSRIQVVMERSIQATTEIFAILDTPPSVLDAPDAIELPASQGLIELEDVTFRYTGGINDAVQELSLRIEPGKTYALVGASGAGKSTILSLLLRLYDPTSGAVKIDGYDLRKVTQKSLRQQIGLVTQETFLFHDSIFQNIKFGQLDATEEEVYSAARAAFAHDFIMAQPQGYDTVIGDKGCLLSGGQQQRIAIARALLKNAPILLLDEATSALDSESEQQIQNALDNLSAGRTVIAIAHRLSTILSADQIVVMEMGRIKEIGTHRELLEQSGYYRRLYDMQFNGSRDPAEPQEEEPVFVEALA